MRALPLLLMGLLAGPAPAVDVPPAARLASRIKELTSLEGVRDNQLLGYGIVVGLAGTGDRRQTVFSVQSLTNLLERMGVSVNPTAIRVNNTAAVVVTANLPPFAQPGTRIDLTAASIGDASNLQGGLLLLTPLRGGDGQVYAMAQGAVVTGGFAAGRGGNSQTVNHPTVGRIAAGAIVERAAPSPAPSATVRLQLKRADFTTAVRISEAINRRFAPAGAPPVARTENAALVVARTPQGWVERPAEFVAAIENLTVEADRAARIVVNERTGTIVLGRDVRLGPATILHGALSIEIRTSYQASQPPPLSSGKTVVTPQVDVSAKEERARKLVLDEGASVDDLARALAAIGATPRDIIAILQNLKAAGAVEADLEMI